MKYRIPKSAVEIRLIPYRHTLFFVDSPKKMARCCPHVGEIPSDCAGMTIACTCGGGAVFIVGVFNKRLDTLVHELAHAVMLLFQHIGMNPADSGGEAFAYMQQYLYERLGPEVVC
jgi:hypothetical protein